MFESVKTQINTQSLYIEFFFLIMRIPLIGGRNISKRYITANDNLKKTQFAESCLFLKIS